MKDNEKRIQEIEKRLSELSETENIKGILVEKYIKCGKPNCKCRKGQKHGPYLHLQVYDKESKKIKSKYIKKAEVEDFKEKYIESKEYLKLLKELENLKNNHK